LAGSEGAMYKICLFSCVLGKVVQMVDVVAGKEAY
jgi:hypothetical protein